MGHAFIIHRELGCLWDEPIYQNGLAMKLKSAGCQVWTEVPITVSHKEFRKQYYLDFVANDSLIYELKTVSKLTRAHNLQLLTYLLLLDIRCGKLINFRSKSVEHQSVNAIPNYEEQRRFEFDAKRWEELSERDRLFTEILTDLLKDWGVYLETSLYEAGLVHFLGGEDSVYCKVPMLQNQTKLGTTRLPLIDEHSAFHLTATSEDKTSLESHLRRFLKHTCLTRLQWVNLNHHHVELITLRN